MDNRDIRNRPTGDPEVLLDVDVINDSKNWRIIWRFYQTTENYKNNPKTEL